MPDTQLHAPAEAVVAVLCEAERNGPELSKIATAPIWTKAAIAAGFSGAALPLLRLPRLVVSVV